VTRQHPLSDLQRGLDLLIDQNGSPDPATAVTELLDDLRDRIWAHYESVLLITFREDRDTSRHVEISDQPF
jgi:hypothetical protein